jgi:hypothetical protein
MRLGDVSLSLRAPKRAPRWDGQPVLDNGAILVGHCSVIQPAGPTSSELLQTTPATFFSSLSLAPVNRSDVVQLAVANATVNLCGQLRRRSCYVLADQEAPVS